MNNCDCACHPYDAPWGRTKQTKFQFGEIELAGKMEPCWCCWCHYVEGEGENDG